MHFRWNRWNVEHITKHDVTPDEAEAVVERATTPYPRRLGGGKYVVRAQTETGRYLQVIYVFDPSGVRFVIHARPLNESEKRQFRRGKQR